jgi:hypothetical protein
MIIAILDSTNRPIVLPIGRGGRLPPNITAALLLIEPMVFGSSHWFLRAVNVERLMKDVD